MKLSLAFSMFAACMTYGCANHPNTVTAPSYPNAITVVVDTVHCRPTKAQSMLDSGMTSLLCVMPDGSAVGVVLASGDWETLKRVGE